MRAWFTKNGLQLLVILLSVGVAVGLKLDHAHVNVYLGILSACAAVGIKLMPFEPFTLPQQDPKAETKAPARKDDNDLPPPPALMALAFAVMVFGLNVITSVIMSKTVQAGRLNCTNIAVDAGTPDGAGK